MPSPAHADAKSPRLGNALVQHLSPQPETSITICAQVRRFLVRDELGNIDASAVNGPECYQRWLESRSEASLDPAKSFQRCLTAHLTGSDGRQPFLPDEESAILKIVRLKTRWPAFVNTDSTIGLKGFRAYGYHEKSRTGISPSPRTATTALWSPLSTASESPGSSTKSLKRKLESLSTADSFNSVGEPPAVAKPASARSMAKSAASLQRMAGFDKFASRKPEAPSQSDVFPSDSLIRFPSPTLPHATFGQAPGPGALPEFGFLSEDPLFKDLDRRPETAPASLFRSPARDAPLQMVPSHGAKNNGISACNGGQEADDATIFDFLRDVL